ncbi:MAG: tetraacyldisaccharide 4'-kinase [Gammaproteobacteria bacterium]|nr:tetraacyldisaccharide 4'-kinase [Gammaproteobacteria bacterium]
MSSLQAVWYRRKKSPWSFALWPLAALFGLITAFRRGAYRCGFFKVHHPAVPVVVVGNITVGGTGKSPLIITLAKQLRKAGFHPGILSRGYRGAADSWPQAVGPDSDPLMFGDEPVMIAARTRCPVAVGPDRVAAVRKLLVEHAECDVILSDDGLQHYRLGRDIEIVVVDGARRFGNGLLLPAGPLREPIERLAEADFVVTNGGHAEPGEYGMTLRPLAWRPVTGAGERMELNAFDARDAHAVAAIGHPERFFSTLTQLGIRFDKRTFPDHHPLWPADLAFDDELPILMTEKDAVKCRDFALENAWYLEVEATVSRDLIDSLLLQLPKTSHL